MISNAKLSYLRISPRKVRLVADLIRGKKVVNAKNILAYTRKKAAEPILKLLNQALANADDKGFKVDESNLFISEIFVDEGPSFKRILPRARGRADVIQKRTSHITLVLDEVKKTKKKVRKKVKKEAELKKVEGPEKKEEIKEEKKKARPRFKQEKKRPKRIKGIKRFFRRKAI